MSSRRWLFPTISAARFGRLGSVLACTAIGAMPALAGGTAPSDPPAAAWDWRLSGVVVGPELREALFTRPPETQTATEGQQIDGWTVASINRFEVTLTRAGMRQILKLEGWSPAEQEAADRARADAKAAALAKAVSADLHRQQQDQQDAEAELAEATRLMTMQ